MRSSLLLPPEARAACDPSVAFRFADGRTARSIADLVAVLEASPDLAEHHRPHFHPWIRDVLGDAALAEEVRRLAGWETGDTFRTEFLRTIHERLTGRWRPGS